jgi:hypothetical protein
MPFVADKNGNVPAAVFTDILCQFTWLFTINLNKFRCMGQWVPEGMECGKSPMHPMT